MPILILFGELYRPFLFRHSCIEVVSVLLHNRILVVVKPCVVIFAISFDHLANYGILPRFVCQVLIGIITYLYINISFINRILDDLPITQKLCLNFTIVYLHFFLMCTCQFSHRSKCINGKLILSHVGKICFYRLFYSKLYHINY